MEIHTANFFFSMDKTALTLLIAIPLLIIISLRKFQDMASEIKLFINKKREHKKKNSYEERIDIASK